jgi:peroxin-7
MSMMLWDLGRPEDPFMQRYEHHTEFALGVDFNIFVEGQVATCAWDERTLRLLFSHRHRQASLDAHR